MPRLAAGGFSLLLWHMSMIMIYATMHVSCVRDATGQATQELQAPQDFWKPRRIGVMVISKRLLLGARAKAAYKRTYVLALGAGWWRRQWPRWVAWTSR